MLFWEPGKRKSRRSLAAMSAGAINELLFIKDTSSGRRLLVDSGAQRSILPASAADVLVNGHGPLLDAANGTSIRTFCTRYVTMCFHGHQFGWDFIIASVGAYTGHGFFVCSQTVSGRCEPPAN